MTYLAYCACSVYRQVTALLDAAPHDTLSFLAFPAGKRNAPLQSQSAQTRRSANAWIAHFPLATTKSDTWHRVRERKEAQILRSALYRTVSQVMPSVLRSVIHTRVLRIAEGSSAQRKRGSRWRRRVECREIPQS